MNLRGLVNQYRAEGYTLANANAKVCQDVILNKIAKTTISRNVTIKGGVVMMGLSKDKRRATSDLDIDFIRYSLDDESIINFIQKLNNVGDKISVEVILPIKKLNHQDYDGKRVFVRMHDNYKNTIEAKIDIGVHKDFDVKQEEFYFDLSNIEESVSLLVNSKEQIIVEKLKSLLKIGFTSTRYKDVFDFYYLINMTSLDKDKLLIYINKYICDNENMKEDNVLDIYKRLNSILNNKVFTQDLNNVKNNWLQLPVRDVIKNVLEFFKSLETAEV